MIALFSTFLSPHMKPLCDWIYQYSNKHFIYIETNKMTAERKSLGYEYPKDQVPYVINLTGNIREQKKIANEAACVIINVLSVDISIVKERIKNKQLTFFISERIFKRGWLKILDPRMWKQLALNLNARNKPVYLLCMSSFAAKDFILLGFRKSKCYKFGYFPESSVSQEKTDDKKHRKALHILWAGRMINWKRPKFAVKIIQRALKKGVDCELQMIGDGLLLEKTKRYVDRKRIGNIKFLGLQSNQSVRKYMSDADVFLSTSNRREGWGVVINEALAAGIPVVAGDAVGAAGYIIRNGFNGYLYPANSLNGAVEALMRLRNATGIDFKENAVHSLDLWNAEIAAQRLWHMICQMIEQTDELPSYDQGPMSIA